MEFKSTIFGQRIAKRRKEIGMKQNELAEIIGVSNNHLSCLENGKENPSVDVLFKICNVLEVTPDYLLMGSMHSNNVPQNITDSLRLCKQEDIKLVQNLVEDLVERNGKEYNEEHYI